MCVREALTYSGCARTGEEDTLANMRHTQVGAHTHSTTSLLRKAKLV